MSGRAWSAHMLNWHPKMAAELIANGGGIMTIDDLLESHAVDHQRGDHPRHRHVPCPRCDRGTMMPVAGSTSPSFICSHCGRTAHNRLCVDPEGHVECVCGLDMQRYR